MKIKESHYQLAKNYSDSQNFEKAISEYLLAGDYSDSVDLVTQTKYTYATQLIGEKKFAEASDLFQQIGDYKDSRDQIRKSKYLFGEQLFGEEKYYDAAELFMEVYPYDKSLTYCKQAADSLKNVDSNKWSEINDFVLKHTEVKQAVAKRDATVEWLQGNWVGSGTDDAGNYSSFNVTFSGNNVHYIEAGYFNEDFVGTYELKYSELRGNISWLIINGPKVYHQYSWYLYQISDDYFVSQWCTMKRQ